MSLEPADFSYVRKLVYDNSAILLEPGKEYLVKSRLRSLLTKEKLNSFAALINQLRTSPYGAMHQDVVEAMTTNETSFFRDIHPFEAMKKHIIPEMQKKRSATRRLNIWSGACSSGQEPYSMAMLIRENFPMLSDWGITIVASDISEEMLNTARTGCYGQLEMNRGLPALLMVKYFEKNGSGWQARADIRKMIKFVQLNLSGSWPQLADMDIIFLRNVLIYFDKETKQAILEKIRQRLKPDGYLFLGSAETTFNLSDAFERVLLDKAVCYRLRS